MLALVKVASNEAVTQQCITATKFPSRVEMDRSMGGLRIQPLWESDF